MTFGIPDMVQTLCWHIAPQRPNKMHDKVLSVCLFSKWKIDSFPDGEVTPYDDCPTGPVNPVVVEC
jgi:hypothetical protein